MTQLLIKKATILCPSSKYHLKKKDMLIKNGIIDKIGDQIEAKGVKVIDKKNTYISIGWMDLFSDFCDPGNEQKENAITGSNAALAGGYTDVCLIPNRHPNTNNKSSVEYLKSKSDIVNIHPIGNISNNLEGKDLSEMYDMKLAGAIAFSDGLKPVQQAGLLLKAFQYVKPFDGLIIQMPEDNSLSKNGLMNEGIMSTQLGMQGKPGIAESIQVQRDIELLQYTKSRLHFTGISTKKSLTLIKQAKKQGLELSCSVTPYHLFFTDKELATYDANFKVNPPLRTEEDRNAMLKALEDGTIDSIATHHMPQDWDAKQVEFEYAKAGMIGLQTTLPLLVKACEKLPIASWIMLLTENPRKIMNLNIPLIEEKCSACLTIFNTDERWTYNATSNKSLSSNSPFYEHELKGKVLAVINNNQIYIHE